MLRVLVVDDKPVFRRQLHHLLARAGLVIVGEVDDIASAAEIVAAQPPDLALVDIVLPDIDGLEGTRRLLALAPSLRVILTSAYRDWDGIMQAAALAAGAEAFVAKDDLDMAMVRAWLRRPAGTPGGKGGQTIGT